MGSIEPGRLLDGRYRLTARRASGATATVWSADDEFLRRRVAVKLLHEHLADDTELLERFLAEARAAATVDHPALVAVYDTIADRPGIVLEWVDGLDLRQRLDRGPIRPDEVVGIATAVCDGLTALHHRGLVHRDVKPANILLGRDGRTKLTDFGIATARAGDRTATGVVLGTAKYLAPEQVTGAPVDARTDLFALAAVLYEALTGRPPWSRDGDLPTALARLEEDPIDLRALQPDIDPALTGAIMRALAREPDRRWPTAVAFAAALTGAEPMPVGTPAPTLAMTSAPARSESTAATAALRRPPMRHPEERVTARPHRPTRRRWPRVVGTLVIAAIAALGWVLVTGAVSDPGSNGTGSSGTGSNDTGSNGTASIGLVGASAFDPEGTGTPGEHDARAPLAIDGDPATAWTTEGYTERTFGAKSGVGLVLRLDGAHTVREVEVATAAGQDWAVDVRVADDVTAAAAQAAADFGPIVGGGRSLAARAVVPVDGTGSAVLLWITDLGTDGPPHRLRVTEVTVR